MAIITRRGVTRAGSLVETVRRELVWALPLLFLWLIYFSPRHVLSASTALTALVALAILALAARRPDRCLLALLIVFPFQAFILSKLWVLGVPARIDSHLGAWKETLGVAVVIAGARAFIRSGRRADTLDRVALAFILFVGAYALLQSSLVPTAPSASSIRLLGFRETTSFVILLLAARHAPLGPDFARRAARALFAVATIVAGAGIYEAIDPNGWNHFVIHTIGLTRYQTYVLNSPPANPSSILNYSDEGGSNIERIGSVFTEDSVLAWFLILPFAIGIERIVRRTASPLMIASTVLIGAAESLTQTRSAVLGAVIVVLLTLLPAAGRRIHWRTQASLLVGALLLVAVPFALATGLGTRVSQATNTGGGSTAGHLRGLTEGVDTLTAHPFGLGLGTGAGTGQRYGVTGYVIPEDNYLEVADEAGVLAGILFLWLTLALLLWLRRAARGVPDPLIAATWAASVGLAVSAIFLQTWSTFPVSWTFWGTAGIALAAVRAASTRPPGPGARSAPELQPESASS